MYCARCGQLLGVADRLCPACGLDLNGSGAIRMTKGEWPGSEQRVWTRTHAPEEPAPTPPAAPPSPQQDESAQTFAAGQTIPAAQTDPAAQPGSVADPSSQPTPARHPVSPPTPVRDPAPVDPALDLSTVDLSQFDLDEDLATPIRQVAQAVEERHARRNRMALTVLSIAVLAALIPLSIVVYNLLNLPGVEATATPSPTATKASVSPVKASTKPSASAQPSTTTPATSPSATVTPSSTPLPFPKGARVCSTDVAASTNTSCEFATNVAEQVDRTRTGSWVISAHSPVTNKDYTMNCSRGDFIVCSGGNAAVVYVRPS